MASNDESPATQKQIDYMLSLAGCKYLSQLKGYTSISLTMAERSGKISKSRASAIIADLLKK